MSNSRMRQLARELLEHSNDGKISWSKASIPNSYKAEFPELLVLIFRTADVVALSLANANGQVTESFIATPMEKEDHELLEAVFTSAEEHAPGGSDNLDKALKYLNAV